ncbi:MAG: DEAD/DEAH box helicase family protein [Planctomycetes bacterium]|nr:DEAD/DEAH box helicase family protein [Planctomycetota bacterium]
MANDEKKPEEIAREEIDGQLADAGWKVQDRDEMNLDAGDGVAVREFRTDGGPCDYLLYARLPGLDMHPLGVIEAKRAGTVLTSVEAQNLDYASKVPAWLKPKIRPLPFLYESTGKETRFTNRLGSNRSRRVFWFHQPDALAEIYEAELAVREKRIDAPPASTVIKCLEQAPPLDTTGMWPAQIRAVNELEETVCHGKRRALIHMATGSGKSFTAVSAIYRQLRYGHAKRVLFLVDRGNLGKQAFGEFDKYVPRDDPEGRTMTTHYNVTHLKSNKIDSVNSVVITTIQRLYSMLKGEPDYDADLEEQSAFDGPLVKESQPVVYNKYLPPEFFDFVWIDECHRSIFSVWQQVLDYFDATLIGLTATPGKRAYAFFQRNVIAEYSHSHAVRDKVNVPYEVHRISTQITEEGAKVEADAEAKIWRRDRYTRERRWEQLDEDLEYSAKDLDRSVVALDQIRTVIKELHACMFTSLFPRRTGKHVPKTLIFAKSDAHAEDILLAVRDEFGLDNQGAMKITYKPERKRGDTKKPSGSHKPDDMIRAFRLDYNPRIAVTVDMIATGTDIKPLECVVFMRTVKSRLLFDQMKGRGVRVIPSDDLRAVTPDAGTKTHFVIVDCVGAFDEKLVEPPIIRQTSLSMDKLLERVSAGDLSEKIVSTLAGRLDRVDRRLTPEQEKALTKALPEGKTLRDIVGTLLDATDTDLEEAKARELAGLEPDASPNEEQIKAAQKHLREEALAPLKTSPELRKAILNVNRKQDQVLDNLSLDVVTVSAPAPEHQIDHDKKLVDEFKAFVDEHRDEIAALQILYSKPYGERLTREQIVELAEAIEVPGSRDDYCRRLWLAYYRLEKSRVRGASQGRLWTDIVSLARHALHPDEDLVPFADVVNERFDAWLERHQQGGKTFTGEQLEWLRLIRDQIVVDYEVRPDDLEQVEKFKQHGGLGTAFALFGAEINTLLADLNRVLVA